MTSMLFISLKTVIFYVFLPKRKTRFQRSRSFYNITENYRKASSTKFRMNNAVQIHRSGWISPAFLRQILTMQ